jgi:HSP90 family molecular chaperone
MKINYGKIIAMWVLLMWSMCTVLWLTSCATPNAAKQKKHYDKFIYYGGKIDTATRTVPVEVLVKGKDGKDSTINVDVEVDCKEAQIEYKDRWHIRRMDKQERDSLKHVQKMLELQLKAKDKEDKEKTKQVKELTKQVKELTNQAKEETKQVKAENRSPWIWVILAAIGLVALVLIKTNRI